MTAWAPVVAMAFRAISSREYWMSASIVSTKFRPEPEELVVASLLDPREARVAVADEADEVAGEPLLGVEPALDLLHDHAREGPGVLGILHGPRGLGPDALGQVEEVRAPLGPAIHDLRLRDAGDRGERAGFRGEGVALGLGPPNRDVVQGRVHREDAAVAIGYRPPLDGIRREGRLLVGREGEVDVAHQDEGGQEPEEADYRPIAQDRLFMIGPIVRRIAPFPRPPQSVRPVLPGVEGLGGLSPRRISSPAG